MREKLNFKLSKLSNIGGVKSAILTTLHRFVKQGYYDISWGRSHDIKHIGDLKKI